MNVQKSTAYLHNKKAVTNTFIIKKVKDIDQLFNNAINDAKTFASFRGGNIHITRTTNSLYINYLDVKDCTLIDHTYLINK